MRAVAALAGLALIGAACSGDGKTDAEHRADACDGFYEVIEKAAAGDREITGSTLEAIVDSAEATDDPPFAAAVVTWTDGIRAGDGEQVDGASVLIDRLCEGRLNG